MHHLDHAGYNIGATITSILPMAQKVYTGDGDGRVVGLLLETPPACPQSLTYTFAV